MFGWRLGRTRLRLTLPCTVTAASATVEMTLAFLPAPRRKHLPFTSPSGRQLEGWVRLGHLRSWGNSPCRCHSLSADLTPLVFRQQPYDRNRAHAEAWQPHRELYVFLSVACTPRRLISGRCRTNQRRPAAPATDQVGLVEREQSPEKKQTTAGNF